MSDNPYWSSSLAATTSTVISSDGPSGSISFTTDSTAVYWENSGYETGYLSSYDTLDFVSVNMTVGNSYSVGVLGNSPVDVYLFDSGGWLQITTDPDDYSYLPDDFYGYDSIIDYRPDYSGTHYFMVGFTNSSTSGSWTMLATEDLGGDYANGSSATTTTITTTTESTDLGTVVAGSSSGEQLSGSSSVETFRGYSGDDTVFGGGGGDVVYGNQGLDYLYGESGDDTMFGGQNDGPATTTNGVSANRTGTEYMFGGDGNDVLYGNFGAERMEGEAGNDTLFGGQDDDTLVGGTGNDVLYGNLGSDVFVFNATDEGADTIRGFSTADDSILLNGMTVTSATDSSSGYLLTLSSGTTVELIGVTSTDASSITYI